MHCQAWDMPHMQVKMTSSIALLARDLVKAAIEGRLPRGMGSRGRSSFSNRRRPRPAALAACGGRQCNRITAAQEGEEDRRNSSRRGFLDVLQAIVFTPTDRRKLR